MRALLLGLALVPLFAHADVSELIAGIKKVDSYAAKRFEAADTDPLELARQTENYIYPICGYDKCDEDQKLRLQKKLLGIIKKSWEYGIEKEAQRLDESHKTISFCSPEAVKMFAGEAGDSCGQFVKCDGPNATRLMQLVQELDKSQAFSRTLEKEELEFEGLDLSSTLSNRYPINGGYRSSMMNGMASYTNRKGGKVQDGISTHLDKLAGIVTMRAVTCDRDRKVKSDGEVKSEKIVCAVVLSKNAKPEILYGEAKGFFSSSIVAPKDPCFKEAPKKKR